MTNYRPLPDHANLDERSTEISRLFQIRLTANGKHHRACWQIGLELLAALKMVSKEGLDWGKWCEEHTAYSISEAGEMMRSAVRGDDDPDGLALIEAVSPARAHLEQRMEHFAAEAIEVPPRLRHQINEQTVDCLMESIASRGQQYPITVMFPDGGEEDRPKLVAGLHRMEACRRLGREVACWIFDGTETEARLWEIEENLIRAELTVLERSEHFAEWIRITEDQSAQLAPIESKRTDGKGHRPEGGINAAVRELGIDRTEAQRSVKIAGMTPEAKLAAQDAGITHNQSALLAVAKEPSPEAQIAMVKNIKARGSVAAAGRAAEGVDAAEEPQSHHDADQAEQHARMNTTEKAILNIEQGTSRAYNGFISLWQVTKTIGPLDSEISYTARENLRSASENLHKMQQMMASGELGQRHTGIGDGEAPAPGQILQIENDGSDTDDEQDDDEFQYSGYDEDLYFGQESSEYSDAENKVWRFRQLIQVGRELCQDWEFADKRYVPPISFAEAQKALKELDRVDECIAELRSRIKDAIIPES